MRLLARVSQSQRTVGSRGFMEQKSTPRWKLWLKPSRVVPLLTLLVAAGAGVLTLFGFFQATPIDGIIIALLALLAIDALTERLSLLEKIESRLATYSVGAQMKNRSQLPTPNERAQTASEISIVAVSAISLLVNHLGFFERKMKTGCKLRVVLLEPTSPSLQT